MQRVSQSTFPSQQKPRALSAITISETLSTEHQLIRISFAHKSYYDMLRAVYSMTAPELATKVGGAW